MFHLRPILLTFIAGLGLAACQPAPNAAYYNRGAAESLLDVSSEVVNLSVASDQALSDLSNFIQKDQPTRAELYCQEGSPACTKARQALDLFGVPMLIVPAADNTVTLVYERVLARDCENRFIDNHGSPYNLNHPTFGCSTAANMVQMVSDKQQFVSPNLMDDADGLKAVQAYRAYQKPAARPSAQEQGINQSIIDKAKKQ